MEETEESIHTFYIHPARRNVIVSDYENFDHFVKSYNKFTESYRRPHGIYKTIRGRDLAIRKWMKEGTE